MSALITFLSSVLGSYEPVTYEVYNSASEQYDTVIASGLAGVDWPYLAAVLVLAITVYSVFKCLGGMLCRSS